MYQESIDVTNHEEKTDAISRCMNMLEAAAYYQNIGKSVDAALYLYRTHLLLTQMGDALEDDKYI